MTILDSLGLVKNRLSIVDAIKSKKMLLPGIIIRDVYVDTILGDNDISFEGVVINVDNVYSKHIETGNLLYINDVLFKVLSINDSSSTCTNINTVFYFSERNIHDSLPFSRNSVVEIEVIQDAFKPQTDQLRFSHIPITLLSFYFSQDIYLNMDVAFLDVSNVSLLKLRNLFNISLNIDQVLIQNVFLLHSINFTSSTGASIVLRSVDNRTNVAGMASEFISAFSPGMELFIFVIDTCVPEIIKDYNGLWGAYVDNTRVYLSMNNSSLVNHTNAMQFSQNTVEYIYLNGQNRYEPTATFIDPNAGLLMALKDNSFPLPRTERGVFVYQLIGHPLSIFNAIQVNNVVVRYRATNTLGLFNELSRFVGKFMLVIDYNMTQIWKIRTCRITSLSCVVDLELVSGNLSFPQHSQVLTPRIVYVVPIMYQTLSVLGNIQNKCFINKSLGIGTEDITETLTVAGNASVRNKILWNDSASVSPFYVEYSSNVFNMNNMVTISNNNVQINTNMLSVRGVVSANDFMSVSDKRLKKNITDSLPKHDLDLIKKLNITNYEYIDSKTYGHQKKKGVIAQDVEGFLPEVIAHVTGYIPSIFEQCIVNDIDSIMIVTTNLVSKDINITNGTCLRIMYDGSIHDVVANNKPLNGSNNVVHEEEVVHSIITLSHKHPLLPPHIVGKHALLYGHLSEYKTIDKDFLFMMAINSIKELDAKVEALSARRVLKSCI
jgi:hypothetical protein